MTKGQNPPFCLVSEGFAGTIPFQQARRAIEADLKSGRRSGNRQAIRTLKAIGCIPSGWKSPSVGLITSSTGERFIIAAPNHVSTIEE